MLYEATSNEVAEKGISGKYLTPYEYVNSAADAKPAADPALAKENVGEVIEIVLKICAGDEDLYS